MRFVLPPTVLMFCKFGAKLGGGLKAKESAVPGPDEMGEGVSGEKMGAEGDSARNRLPLRGV